jgi:hypothetical protein
MSEDEETVELEREKEGPHEHQESVTRREIARTNRNMI